MNFYPPSNLNKVGSYRFFLPFFFTMNNFVNLTAICLLATAFNTAQAQCYRLVWEDEFDGTELDTTAWSYQIGDGCPVNCTWGNGELQWYTRENLEVSGGTMKINIREETVGISTYTSVRLRTYQKMHWTTGRFEARMKLPVGKGLWPAFWMLPEDNRYGIWPTSGEIDIMEMVGHQPFKVYGTIHYGPAYPANQYTGNNYDSPTSGLHEDFHIYAIEWEENEIRWYLDGVLYSTMTPDNLAPYPWRFNRDFHLLLNCAVGGNFPGYPDGTATFPQVMEVDYVRVYQDASKTIVSGPELVLPNSGNTEYYVQPLEGASYTWSVPSDATIISGQGTAQTVIEWGENSGNIEVIMESPACTTSVDLPVEVYKPDCVEALLDYEGTARVSWISSDAVYQDNISNPAPDAVNSSPTVARYDRNPGISYNVLRFTADGFNDAAVMKDEFVVLEMDVYTNAPPGAQISLQLENMQLASLPYPSGRNSVFQANTSVTNAWQRLRFNFTLAPDGGTPNNRINQFLILFQPGTSSNAFFWFDNVNLVDPACIADGIAAPAAEFAGQAWPNPAADMLNWRGPQPGLEAELLDQLGRVQRILPLNGTEASWSLQGLEDGVYWLRVRTEAGWSAIQFVKMSN